MKKCILIFGFIALAGCSSEVAKWKSAGTLVSVSPSEAPVDPIGRPVLGETSWGHTRVETTAGVYTVRGKIGVAQEGVPVTVGYDKKDSSDEYQDMPSYVAFGGHRYEIVR